MKKQIVYLDMDGTIANLYGIENWLDGLRQEKNGLFLNCDILVSQEKLFSIFPQEIFDIRILSMTPKDATKEYCETVKQEKNLWLDKHFPALKKRIYLKYGHNKNLKNSKNAILVDDNEMIRNTWNGLALNPKGLLF